MGVKLLTKNYESLDVVYLLINTAFLEELGEIRIYGQS